MNLVEKKCPNCGANLSFDENDKSCKCEYCKREFEIERDTDSIDKINLIYHDITKNVSKGFKYISIIYFIVFFVIAMVLSIVSFSIFHSNEDNTSILENNDDSSFYLQSLNDISNFDYEFIDTNSKIAIGSETNSNFYFHKVGNSKRICIYLLHNDNGNMLIPIYKDIYSDGEITYTLYIPVIYENIKVEHGSIAHDIANAKVSAPQYFFNLEHTEYSVGYQDIDKLYDDLIKQYEKEYTITKK